MPKRPIYEIILQEGTTEIYRVKGHQLRPLVRKLIRDFQREHGGFKIDQNYALSWTPRSDEITATADDAAPTADNSG